MHPVVALVTAGVEMDVLGLTYPEYSDAERNAIVRAHPRSDHFKEDILQAFYDGIKHKPETTFGNVKADVLADKDLTFRRANFCQVIRESALARMTRAGRGGAIHSTPRGHLDLLVESRSFTYQPRTQFHGQGVLDHLLS
jgi:hypothetical protein